MSRADGVIAIVNAGLVSSVGLSAPASCAAIRAGLNNHTQTRFVGRGGEWMMGAEVPLPKPWRGREKLVQMLGLALLECLEPSGLPEPVTLPLFLCVAEPERNGRLDGLDEHLLSELAARTRIEFHPKYSAIVPHGRVGVAVALSRARELMRQQVVRDVLIAGGDSLLTGRTLAALATRGRLLTERNPNGFVPGEAASAVMITSDPGPLSHLVCAGLGFGTESATITSEEPLRADGLTAAIKQALTDAGCEMQDLAFRITDNSGEHYYFKEAALALNRTMRVRKDNFDFWHPADCIGETGSAIGPAALAVALTACRKRYAIGPNILFHVGNDAGQRAAAILHYHEAA
jgi:3-oxoacyl-[acyl-carrier-protein] synthase-1